MEKHLQEISQPEKPNQKCQQKNTQVQLSESSSSSQSQLENSQVQKYDQLLEVNNKKSESDVPQKELSAITKTQQIKQKKSLLPINNQIVQTNAVNKNGQVQEDVTEGNLSISNSLNKSKLQQQKQAPKQEQDDWDDDSKFSDEDQNQNLQIEKQDKFQGYSQCDGISQYGFGVDYDQVKKFTQSVNYENEMILKGLEENQQYKSAEYPVQRKHLLVLYLLFRNQVYDICKRYNNRIDLHPSNKGKIILFGKSQKQMSQTIRIVEQMINKIGIVKLPIRYDQAVKMKISRKLANFLNTKKLIIFKYGQHNDKNYYIGGKGSQSSVLAQFQLIKNLKYKYFKLFDYKNTRSYKIILEQILNFPTIIKNFQKSWSLKYLQIVNFIPNSNGSSNREMGHKFRRQKQQNICILMTTYSNQIISPKQLQIDLVSFIKSNFYCITLIFDKTQNYLPKLNVQGVKFKIVSQKKFKRSYLYIICQKKDYQLKVKQIIQAIDNMKQLVYGARYFNNLFPTFREYNQPSLYKFRKYPEKNPYSHAIFAKKGFKFDSKEYLMNFCKVQTQQKQEANN